jgi:hypothetical protein
MMYQEEQESLMKTRAISPLNITEIISAEGGEPLTQGRCILFASLPWEKLYEPIFSGSQLVD